MTGVFTCYVGDCTLPVSPATFVWIIPVALAATIIKMLAVFTVYMVGVAMLTLAERKISAWIQDRHGPNRVLRGWGQPLADGVKNFMKEETLPGMVNKPLFILAPALSFIPAMCTWAVIPFAAPWNSPWGRIDMVLADLPVGYLFILAISSLGVYGIVLAGWSSNNKYALLGGIRSSAQMISYEIALGMSTIPVLILAGDVSMSTIIREQATGGWHVFSLTIAAFIFLVAAFAETNRLPFDLPESESELVAGYHTEYSAMKFSLFFIAEYANMVTASALMATLYFGGWTFPGLAGPPYTGLQTILTLGIFLAKVLFFLFTFMWIRWTLPRFRYDQLMSLGWKVMLPLALAYIVVIAGATLGLDRLGLPRGPIYGLALFAINIVLLVILFLIIDRGRIISPASARVRAAELARLRAIAARTHPVAETVEV
ncbi:MAG TPA: NADH-quinone oxidoreductase subunit NuoH [Gemmatimonadaceae bacterium]|jgi:NADH-quinone oxidoreductase subunit H|nr:NADH-quinone oxidoreductase subunit NuoH [Gemmatimonadaceae bacterium]